MANLSWFSHVAAPKRATLSPAFSPAVSAGLFGTTEFTFANGVSGCEDISGAVDRDVLEEAADGCAGCAMPAANCACTDFSMRAIIDL